MGMLDQIRDRIFPPNMSKYSVDERNRYADLAANRMNADKNYDTNGALAPRLHQNSRGKMEVQLTEQERDAWAHQGLKMAEEMTDTERARAFRAAERDEFVIRVTSDDQAQHQREQSSLKSLALQHGRSLS